MKEYGILKREGISIDNSVIKYIGENPYDREFINTVAKYAETWKLQAVKNNTFTEGLDYTIKNNKFIPSEYTDRKPRVLLVANNYLSFFPKYVVRLLGGDYLIKGSNFEAGYELCIIHESILNVYQDNSLTITRTMNLDNNMTATFVIISKDNQNITLSETL